MMILIIIDHWINNIRDDDDRLMEYILKWIDVNNNASFESTTGRDWNIHLFSWLWNKNQYEEQ